MTIPVYTIEPSARCRVMTVVVNPSGTVCVRVPLIYDPAEVHRFVLRSAGWIEQQQHIARSPPEKPQNLSVQIGDRNYPYTITWKCTRKTRSIIIHPDGRIEVRAPHGATIESLVAAVEKRKDWIQKTIVGQPTGGDLKTPGNYRDSIAWKGETFHYSVSYGPPASKIYIKILIDRSIEVVSPPGASPAAVKRAMETKAEKIYEQVISKARAVAVRRTFCDGETYPFLGGTLTIRISRGKNKISLAREGQYITLGIADGLSPAHEQKITRRAVELTLKHETYSAVMPRVIHYSAAFGVVVPPVAIRKNKKQWGCCTNQQRLSFSIEVCMLPPRLLDYVVAHEICHFLVMDHSDLFWKVLQVVMPDFLDRKAELKRDTPLYRLFCG